MKPEQQELFTLEDIRNLTTGTGFLVGRTAVEIDTAKMREAGAWTSYIGLCYHADESGEIRKVKTSAICELMHVARSAFFRHVQVCIECGLVERTKTGYRLISPELSESRAQILDKLIDRSPIHGTVTDQNSPTHGTINLGSPTHGTVQNSQVVETTEKPSGNERASFNTNTNTKRKKKETTPHLFAATLPEWMPVESWEAFVEMRKVTHQPLTEKAEGMIIKKLGGFRQAGYDVAEILNESTMNNWRGVFLPKRNGNGAYAKSTQQQQFDDAQAEVNRRIDNESRAFKTDCANDQGDGGSDRRQAIFG